MIKEPALYSTIFSLVINYDFVFLFNSHFNAIFYFPYEKYQKNDG